MSDFSQFPTGTSGEPSQRSRPQSAESGEPKTARIIGVPNELRETRQPVRLRGTVERVNQDGSIRVSTPRGEIDIRIEDQNIRPREGQRVEIEIQPGRAPQEATISIAERPEIHRHAPPPNTREAGAPPPRQTSTPVRVDIQRPDTAVQQRGNEGQTLRPAETIRLLPLAPDLIKDVVRRPIETLQAVIQQVATLNPAIVLEIVATTNQVTTPYQPPVIASESPPVSITLQPPSVQVLTTALPALNFNPIENFVQTPRIIPKITQTVLPPVATNIEVNIALAPSIESAPVISTTLLKQNDIIQPTQPIAPPASFNAGVISVQPAIVQIVGLNTPPILTPGSTFQPAVIAPQNPFIQIPFTQFHEAEKVTPTPLQPKLHTEPLILQDVTKAGSNTAQIVGFIEENRAVISFTPIAQPFALTTVDAPLFVVQDSALSLPVGTQITVLPQTSSAGILPSQNTQSTLGSITIPSPGAPLPVDLLSPAGSWPIIEQLYQALAQNTPQAAHAMSNMTPNAATPTQFGSAAMFFIAAIRSGDLTNWLGDKATNLLRASGKLPLLSRLSQEGSLLSRAGAEPTSQDWRGVAIPHVWQNDIHKLALHYKQDEGSDDKNHGNNKPTRFLFNLSLDKMGAVQLDGLFQGLGTKNMRLDLIVRTEEKFHQNIHMDMRKIYSDALKSAQVTGELSFQNDPKQWVHVTTDKEDLFSEKI